MYKLRTPIFVVKDHELIQQLGVEDVDHFMYHRPSIKEKYDPLRSKSLFALTGQRWHDLRKVIAPYFSSTQMATTFDLISDCSKRFNEYFLKKEEDVIEVELKDIFTRFANDVIALTAFGLNINSLENRDNEFYVMGENIINHHGFWNTMKYYGYLYIPKVLAFFKVNFSNKSEENYFTTLIDEIIIAREERGIVRSDIINLLLEARNDVYHKEEAMEYSGFVVIEEKDMEKMRLEEITNSDIAAQVMQFFFAGLDSVSSLMSFVVYELALNPHIQQTLREEIEKYNLTYEELLKMEYMDMVVSETLRKWPNVMVADRMCMNSYTIQPSNPEEKPIRLEKGTEIWFPIYAIHHDPKYYPDPDEFDPERFSKENEGNIIPCSYIPFGIGPRCCIGARFGVLETKILLFHLLSEFELVPNKKTQIPIKILKKSCKLQAENGFWVDLKPLRE